MNITPQQNELVRTQNSNVLCLASAGSGKSTALVHRIEYLIKVKKIHPSKIYLFSFSQTATKEMREKLKEALGLNIYRLLTVSTFHGYAFKVCTRNHEVIKIDPKKLKVLDEGRLLKLIQSSAEFCLRNKKINELPKKSDMENAITNYFQIRHYANYAGCSDEIRVIMNDVIKYMTGKSLFLYDDLLHWMLNMFKKTPSVLEKCASDFDFIILDEAQDTAGLVFDVLERLLTPTHHFMAVGDIQQNLYGFNGCDPDRLIDFSNQRKCKIMQLSETFRFGESIADLANMIVGDMDIQDQYKIKTLTNQISKDVKFITCPKEIQPEEIIIESVKTWLSEKVEPKEIHVLCRTNKECAQTVLALAAAGIPASQQDTRFFDRRDVKYLLSGMEIIANNSFDAWKAYMSQRTDGIDEITITTAFAGFEGDLDEFEKHLKTKKIAQIGPARLETLTSIIGKLKKLRVKLDKGLRDFLEIAQILEFKQTKFYKESGVNREGQANADEIQGFIEILTNLAQEYEGDMLIFPQWIKMAMNIENNVSNAVGVMTVHKSKGMTLPYLVLNTGSFFSFPGGDKEKLWEKFCLYVGVTRAKTQLVYIAKPNNPTFNYIPLDDDSPDPEMAEIIYLKNEAKAKVFDALLENAIGRGEILMIDPDEMIASSEKAVLLRFGADQCWIPSKSLEVRSNKLFLARWLSTDPKISRFIKYSH